MTTRLFSHAVAIIFCVGLVCPSLAQPPRPPHDQRSDSDIVHSDDASGREPNQPRDPARLRRLLERSRDHIDQALKALDDGQPPQEVIRRFPMLNRLMTAVQEREARRSDFPDAGPSGPGPDSDRQRSPGPRNSDRQWRPPVFDPFSEIDMILRSSESDRSPEKLDRDLSDAERADVNEFISAASPPLAEDLIKLQSVDPDAARERYRRVYPRVQSALKLKQEDPELHKLILQGLKLRWEIAQQARWIARNLQDPSIADEVEAKKKDLRSKIEEGLPLAEQIRTLAMKRQLSKDKAVLIDRLVNMSIERERRRLEEQRHDGPPDAAAPPERGISDEDRDQRPDADRPGSIGPGSRRPRRP